MKVKFNKASHTDGTLVTLNLAQFDGDETFNLFREQLLKNDQVYVTVEGQDVVFYVNRVRNGKAVTAVTHCFPRFLRLPQIGRPVFAEVQDIV
jgi:hypothetical protein